MDQTYNLIRGCNPAPGAWTTHDGRKLFLFDCQQAHRPHLRRGEGQESSARSSLKTGGSLTIHGQGGFIEVQRLRWEDGKKIQAAEAGLEIGTILGG